MLTMLRPMATAPKDGCEIIAKVAGVGISFRVAWDGVRWASDGHPVRYDFEGWAPMPVARRSRE